MAIYYTAFKVSCDVFNNCKLLLANSHLGWPDFDGTDIAPNTQIHDYSADRLITI